MEEWPTWGGGRAHAEPSLAFAEAVELENTYKQLEDSEAPQTSGREPEVFAYLRLQLLTSCQCARAPLARAATSVGLGQGLSMMEVPTFS